jgi:hypothetical protein
VIGETVPKLISQLKLNTQNQKMECLYKIEIEKEEIKQVLNVKEREKEI